MPFIEKHIFIGSSGHRIHHGRFFRQFNKNFGILVIWDKLFGTFEPEDNNREEMRFGLTKPLNQHHHPVNIVAHEWKSIWQDLRRPLPLKTRLQYLFMPPGWSHDGSSQTSRELQEAYWKQHPTPKRAAEDTPR
jgi:hypothetical protein